MAGYLPEDIKIGKQHNALSHFLSIYRGYNQVKVFVICWCQSSNNSCKLTIESWQFIVDRCIALEMKF